MRARRRPLGLAIGVVAALLVILGIGSTFYTDVLWFKEVGYQDVLWTTIRTKVILGVIFGAAFALLLLINLWIVQKITSPSRLFSVPDEVLERYRATLQPYTRLVVIGGSLMFGLFAGSGASVRWREWLLFQNSTSFGTADPVFQRDIGFYVFKLPFHQFLFTWGFSTLVVITIIVAGAHYFMGGIRPQARGDVVAPEVRAHLSVLLGLIVLLKAWGYRLDQFNLMFSPRGQVTGASYTDINAELPSLKLLVVIALVCSVFFFINARFRNWILPVGGIGILALTSIIASGIYPAAVQRFSVTPNERIKERPFIERNIEATRKAYGLEAVELQPYDPTQDLEPRDINVNNRTIENVRLWDTNVLQDVYLSLQRVKQYYEFLDVDVDRYQFPDGLRQVMLSAREIYPAGLSADAQTWLNTHLVYTHGYGVTASRVDRVTTAGQPSFIIRDIPSQVIEGGPKIDQPRIYYGEYDPTRFVVVGSEQKELDYPQGDRFAETTYAGKGGIRLENIMRRAAFAWRFRDVNLLISSAIKPESKLMFRRAISDRVSLALPFIHVDSDPYIVIAGGRLKWVIDGYTTTSMVPYSQREPFADVAFNEGIPTGNYIRNAVKFVVDAEHGTIDTYAWDESDPILQAWRKIFPTAVKDKSEMPQEILDHVRYPEDLFNIQTHTYGSYHITDPDNFYSKEDAWLVAADPSSTELQSRPVEAYYVLMQLPGQKDLDFVLVRPFSPADRPNLTGYMVAHGDADEYGKLVTYVFPKGESIPGPGQVRSLINNDSEVSPFISLNSQRGSQVLYGNLLIVPVGDSLLYVQPLYVEGQGNNLPELKRVVVFNGERVKMSTTLRGALAALFGQAAPTEQDGEPSPSETVAALLERALRADQAGQEALRRGDFAEYGRQQEIMRRNVQRAAQASGATPSPSPSPRPS
ncbi:MAG TPA: UPF0182 family protein [Actinomycetota bacterium]|nr:UPF0182 family protein [Actinomycetota bacterium]